MIQNKKVSKEGSRTTDLLAKNKADIETIENEIKLEEFEKQKEIFSLQETLNLKIMEKNKRPEKKQKVSEVNTSKKQINTHVQPLFYVKK